MKKIFVFFFLPTFYFLLISLRSEPNNDYWVNNGSQLEEFDPGLLKLRSVSNVIAYADTSIGLEKRATLDYAEFLAKTIRRRFYHGFSHYSPLENWIAWASGNYVWDHLHAIVIADDILKHPNAACSQQAIVLSECFEKSGISYREVNLNGHFALEGKIDNKWYYFDTDIEPKFINGRKSLGELISSDELTASYLNTRSENEIRSIFSTIIYKSENAPIALKAKIFHRVTGVLSIVSIFLMPVFMFFGYKKFGKKAFSRIK